MNLPLTAKNLVACGIQDEIADLESRGAGCGTTARNRTQASQKNFKSKRFCQIVIGAHIEPFDNVRHRIARGKHQDRSLVVILPQSTSYFESVDHREHKIQHYDIELHCGR